MLIFTTVLALSIADLQPLPDDQQVRLSAQAFDDSVQSCVQAMGAPASYCGCVVRGFEMFLPRSDWHRVESGKKARNLSIIAQVEMSCRHAMPHTD